MLLVVQHPNGTSNRSQRASCASQKALEKLFFGAVRLGQLFYFGGQSADLMPGLVDQVLIRAGLTSARARLIRSWPSNVLSGNAALGRPHDMRLILGGVNGRYGVGWVLRHHRPRQSSLLSLIIGLPSRNFLIVATSILL